MSDAVDSKQKILDVAEKIFAEKGFDGARVNEIAGEAGVNKALIYYYFDSKKDILATLFSALIKDFINFTLELFSNNISLSVDISDEIIDNFINRALDYILSKKDILRVAMTESMKTGSNQSIILKIGEMFMSAEIEAIKENLNKNGMHFNSNMKEMLVADFFTGTLPLLNFAIFRDEFAKQFNMTDKECREFFIKSFKKTHLAYHMSNSSQNK